MCTLSSFNTERKSVFARKKTHPKIKVTKLVFGIKTPLVFFAAKFFCRLKRVVDVAGCHCADEVTLRRIPSTSINLGMNLEESTT